MVKQVRKHNCEVLEWEESITYEVTDKPDIVKLDVVDKACDTYISPSHNEEACYAMEITLGKASIKISK